VYFNNKKIIIWYFYSKSPKGDVIESISKLLYLEINFTCFMHLQSKNCKQVLIRLKWWIH